MTSSRGDIYVCPFTLLLSHLLSLDVVFQFYICLSPCLPFVERVVIVGQ